MSEIFGKTSLTTYSEYNSGAFDKRYSGDPNMMGPPTEEEWASAHHGSTNTLSGTGNSSGGGNSFDVNAAIKTVGSLLSSIFGKSDKYTANAYNTLYQQERKTNTMLWIIIGVVVLLAFVFILRKK